MVTAKQILRKTAVAAGILLGLYLLILLIAGIYINTKKESILA